MRTLRKQRAYRAALTAVIVTLSYGCSTPPPPKLTTYNFLERGELGSPPMQVISLAEAFSITLSVAYGSRINDQLLYFDTDRRHVVAHRVYERCTSILDWI